MSDIQIVFDVVKDYALPVAIAVIGWLWKQIKDVDKKLYELNGRVVDVQGLGKVKEEMIQHVDRRIDDLNKRIDQLIALLKP